ncbi:putative aspartic-type endopeptidase opsB [Aspergillus tubingensis]|uniref:putative aspartic-type endopeptidase opsB n=1 Tax=Aspergillus tubingensis TaxID=5068 RepID=UPI00157939CD|nr:probable aspartic-type endopeptidase opsB [Aspergillus tubingensis]GFN14105.1 probable aspartic-type endopeptidase opsB [Aspergillus tubingensis]
MKVPVIERASHVCLTCKSRKKGCDKKLPTCGYCAKRNLPCRYQGSPVAEEPVADAITQIETNAILLQMVSLFGPPSENMSTAPRRTWYHVCRIIQLADLSLQEISRRYFSNFHNWLPVVSHEVFQESLARYNSPSRSAPVDFSVLVLGMCLVTLQPSKLNTHITPHSVYATMKMLFAEAQAIMCVSTYLIQAGLLIAAYEYANGRPEAAHITMGSLARSAFAIGLVDSSSWQTNEASIDSSERLERLNLWWGVIILERLILCEIKDKTQRPTTDCTSFELPLPSDLQPVQTNFRASGSCPHECLPSNQERKRSVFGHQARAVLLLDRVLAVRRHPQTDSGRLVEIHQLDEQLQGFLSERMNTGTAEIGHDCNPIASAVRALCLLHQEVLSYPPNTVDLQGLQHSQAALEMVSNVVVDVARHHKAQIACQNSHADLLPLSCSYTLHMAMRHIQDCTKLVCSHRRSSDLNCLAQLDQEFSDRWKA